MKILHMTGMPSSKYGSIERFFIEQMRQLPDSQILLVYNSQPASKEYLADIQHYRGGLPSFADRRPRLRQKRLRLHPVAPRI